MKKLLFALPLLALAGCAVVDGATAVPNTFVQGVIDGLKWFTETLLTFVFRWWVGLF